MRKYRIAAVSYINTLPFLEGLKDPWLQDHLEVIVVHPARCAELFASGEVDICLCPVGALPGIQGWSVISNYCIGCTGPVRTVSIYSHVPPDEVERVVLSAQSRTSNLLAQVLDHQYWQRSLHFIEPPAKHALDTRTGFLHIGDICFAKEKEFPFRLDLGGEWVSATGLPFAFACWVAHPNVDPGIEAVLNEAFERGLSRIDEIGVVQGTDYRGYLHNHINYDFDTLKRTAFTRFLEAVQALDQQLIGTHHRQVSA